MAIPSSDTDDLFSLGLIRSYVDKEHNPRFVERHWLKQQINDKLDDSDCRFVLLTGEPGAGKSAFMAWLAQQHPDWCRYFIRRDQRTPLGDPGAHSFLLQVGFQLAAIYPDAFSQEQLKITISQRIGQATDSKTVGAEVEKLFASPFYQKVVQIQQEVSQSRNSRVTGIQIGEWYSDSRLVPLTNLQFMALFDPVSRLLKQGNQQQIVVLVDALDELRYRDPELSLLKWLADCPELSTNLRFVLTCRPDDDLLEIFRGSQQRWIQEVSIAEEEQEVTKDLSHYARLLIETPEVNHFLAEMHQNSDEFIKRAVTKASGNFGYLAAVSRAIDDAIRQNKQELLREILILSDLPDTLQDLYAFFLGKIKEAVDKERVPVKGVDGEIGYISVWSAVYKPILGILSVALEPLNPSQIQKLGLIQVDFGDVIGAIRRLQQFLDSDQVRNCYRFYHSTLPEFLTSPATGEQIAYAYFYVNAVEQNQRIVNYYQAEAKSWEESSLEKIAEDSYGRRYLVRHLVEAKQVKELHQLLNWEKDQKNAWFKLKDDKGEIAEFLDDIELAWFQASEAMDREPGKSIGLQCRYALIKGTINSLSDISEALLVTLLRHQDSNWKNKSFTYARQISDPYRRFDSLAALACQSPDTEALKTQLIEAGLKAALVVPCFNHRSYLTNSSKRRCCMKRGCGRARTW